VALIEDVKVSEPPTFKEASQGMEWRKAIEEEIQALRKNKTWDLVPRTKEVHPKSCK